MPAVTVIYNIMEERRIARSNEMRRALVTRARPIQANSKRRAPVSPAGNDGRAPGYLRSQINVTSGIGAGGAYARITTEARALHDGFPYGAYHQRRLHYIRP
jgi:hypothetical protein